MADDNIVKFIRATTRAAFDENIEDIPKSAIVFIEDEQKIWTNDNFYDKASDEVFISNGEEPINPNVTIWIDESQNTEVTDFLSKGYADQLYQPIGNYITDLPENLVTESKLLEKNYTTTKVFENVIVSNWSNDTTYTKYPYVSVIANDYILGSDLGEIYFGISEATNGNYAPICETIDKGIKIWSKVNTQITIPTIKIIRYGNN